jgi:hypothetical protein
MSKETILKNAMQAKLLHFLDNYDMFDMEDYKLLVQNKIKHTACFIYLIKFKYGLLPDKSLITASTTKNWAEEIVNYIKLNINELYDILINNNLPYRDYEFVDIIKKTEGRLQNNDLIKLLAKYKWSYSITEVINRYDGLIDNEMFEIIKPTINTYYDHKYKFETMEVLIKYINYKKKINLSDIKLNEHLFDTPEKYTELFSSLDTNIERDLDTKCFGKKTPPIELVREVKFGNDPKLFKYYDMYPSLYKDIAIPKIAEIIITIDLETNLKRIKNRFIENRLYIMLTEKIMLVIMVKVYFIKQIYNGNKERIKQFLEEFKEIKASNYQRQIKEIYDDMQEYLNEPKKSKKLIK